MNNVILSSGAVRSHRRPSADDNYREVRERDDSELSVKLEVISEETAQISLDCGRLKVKQKTCEERLMVWCG